MAKISLYMWEELTPFFSYESSIIPIIGDTYAGVATPANVHLTVMGRQLLTSEVSKETIIINVKQTS